MRGFFAAVFLCGTLILGFCQEGLAAKSAYDAFYDSSAEFRELDRRLNQIYKGLMDRIPWRERRVLRDEQRKWHDKLFPILVESNGAASRGQKGLAVLRDRVNDLDKLSRSKKDGAVLGMPIAFGMSKKEVAGKLGLANESPLEARPVDEGEGAYTIKLLGKTLPVYFNFMETSFKPFDDGGAKNFRAFISGVLGGGGSAGPEGSYKLSELCAVSVGGLESREEFGIVNEELSKKYKRAYPQLAPMAALMEEDGLMNYGSEDEAIADPSSEFYYEDLDRYIVLSGSWGTLDGSFAIDYVSKEYLDLHVPSVDALFKNLARISDYNDSLIFLPNGADVSEAVWAIGGGEITYSAGPGKYYSLARDWENDGKRASVSARMTPENRVWAVTISYIDDEFPGFEEGLLARLAKKYKKLDATPDAVMHFTGNGSNFDSDFESAENYIHIGFTPHYATQHELSVINKKALNAYDKAYKADQKMNEEKKEKSLDEARKDTGKL